MKRKIYKGVARGKVKAPPSKSYAHRLLICAALANGESKISGVSQSVDMQATLECIGALGAEFTKTGDSVSVFGGIKESRRVFNCHESGSTLRFLLPLALLTGEECTFIGSERLMSRGLGVYEEIFEKQGILFKRDNCSITLSGRLKPDVFTVRGDISSQFISGLLFALPLLNGDSVINLTTQLESRDYVDITIDAMKRFGVEIEKGENTYYVRGNQSYIASNQTVEGDFSNSAFLEAFNILGGDVSVIGLNDDSLQGDKIYRKHFRDICNGTPKIDVSDCVDLAPVLMAMASMKNGAEFIGTRRLKIKESDRASAMQAELAKLGVDVEVYENRVTVGAGVTAPQEALFGHNDHRIVMALTVILSKVGGEIDGCEAVSKSYPDFFDVISVLGIESETV